jgi:hypothetical protein
LAYALITAALAALVELLIKELYSVLRRGAVTA